MSESNIYNTNITITRISYIWNGNYMPRQKYNGERVSHGLVLPQDGIHTYTFADGTVLSADPGHILYLPKGSAYRVNDNKPCNCIAFNFDILEDMPFKPFRMAVGKQANYADLFQTASRFWDSKCIGYQNKIKALLYQVLYMLQNDHCPEYISKELALRFNEIIEYIGTHYTENDISVRSLAERLGKSEVYFRNHFERLYGTSPLQYVKKLRFTKAMELLVYGMYSVREVANLVGYTSEYHFSREFKRFTGRSPLQFKIEQNGMKRH